MKTLALLPTPVEHVVLSMGEKGVNWWRQGGCLHATAAKVAVKSTVGAGDTLLAGMLHGLASGWPDEQVLRTAAALAAHAVSQPAFGISIPHAYKNCCNKSMPNRGGLHIMNTTILLVPNHAAKAANALILARKLARRRRNRACRHALLPGTKCLPAILSG